MLQKNVRTLMLPQFIFQIFRGQIIEKEIRGARQQLIPVGKFKALRQLESFEIDVNCPYHSTDFFRPLPQIIQ